MKTLFYSILIFFFFTSTGVFALTSKENMPVIVSVETYKKENGSRNKVASSMGFVFESDGFILTAYKNLTDPLSGNLLNDIDVKILGDKKVYAANIVGVEPTINLGILKVFPEKDLRSSKMITRTGLEIGQEVFAVQSLPQNSSPLLERGRLVAMNSRECYQESLSSTMLRAEIILDAKSIGTPIFNKDGEVVAIYTGYKAKALEGHIDDPNEIHILPAFLAMNIYDSLKHKKSMLSPWTGFSVMPINDSQQKAFPTKHGDKGGIAMEYIWPESPADKLGVLPNDILVRFGHYRITSPAEFQKWLYMYGVGHKVKLVFLRDLKDYRVVEYTIEERPKWAVPR